MMERTCDQCGERYERPPSLIGKFCSRECRDLSLRVSFAQQVESFWDRVDFDGPEHDEVGTCCWLWEGPMGHNGYGRFRINEFGNQKNAHVISYMLVNTDYDEDMELDHLCSTRRCVRPDHLEQVEHVVNVRRSKATKLTDVEVEEIRRLRGYGMSQLALAQQYGVHQSQISRIVNRKRWSV
jgi:hypothetical protein